jgi:hypothetical protein
MLYRPIAFSIATLMLGAAVATATPVLFGDVDQDTVVDARDLVLLQRHLRDPAGVPLDPDQAEAADVAPFADGTVVPDGEVDAADLMILHRALSESDLDADYLTPSAEAQHHTTPLATDTDADGLIDGLEVAIGMDPLVPDPDADVILKADYDGDLVPNGLELSLGFDPSAADTDGDGIPDGEEDEDGDGTADAFEDADADSLPLAVEFVLDLSDDLRNSDYNGPIDPDEDAEGDGIPNRWELALGLDPRLPDSDENGTPDADEDWDADGLANAWELALGYDPSVVDTDGDGEDDGSEDRDGDGISNADEVVTGTEPGESDTDGDGIVDGAELAAGLDPTNSSDGAADPDDDGLTNAQEIALGLDPNSNDSDGDGTPDVDEDLDEDGLTNAQEIALTTNPLDPDTDRDGLSDNADVDPIKYDTDGIEDATSADTIIYASAGALEDLPGSNPFFNSSNEFDSSACSRPPDPFWEPEPTRVLVKEAPTLELPIGAMAWKTYAWKKYVLMTTYVEEGNTAKGSIEGGQKMLLFDTETKQQCEIMIDPDGDISMEHYMVAEPDQRKTRIYYMGIGSWSAEALQGSPVVRGSPFGYVDADLDVDPCDPEGPGWPVTVFSADDLNDSAISKGIPTLCATTSKLCGWDSMDLLDPQTVVVGNWMSARTGVIRVDEEGTLDVVDVYQIPYYEPPEGNGICLFARPVGPIAVDPTRPPSDRRFALSFDLFCSDDMSAVQHGCVPVAPVGNPACSPAAVTAIGKPQQEYRFDGLKITPTSGMFTQAPLGAGWEGRNYVGFGDYDEMGNLLIGDVCRLDPYCYRSFNGDSRLTVLRRTSGGEHSYFTQVAPAKAAEFHAPDYDIRHGTWILRGPYNLSRVGNALFMSGGALVRFAELVGDDWVLRDSFAARQTALPAGTDVEGAGIKLKGTVLGGSPPSLWWQQSTSHNENQPSHTYLGRVPVATHLPEGQVTSGPGMAWSGERMWLVAEHEGALKVRIRHGGFWFDWQPLPAGVATQGGAAVVSDGSTVEIFARVPDTSHSGDLVYTTRLTSPIDCVPEACTWDDWSAISPSLWTDHTPAAAYDAATGDLYLVFTNMSGMASWLRRPYEGDWDSGHATFIPTDAAPAVAWNPVDSSLWVVARLSIGELTGEMYVGRMTKTDHDPPLYVWDFDPVIEYEEGETWCGSIAWGTAPALALDGSGRMRLYAGQQGGKRATCEAIYDPDAETWSKWRRIRSWARTITAPAPANVHGEINLMTQNLAGRLMEQGLE